MCMGTAYWNIQHEFSSASFLVVVNIYVGMPRIERQQAAIFQRFLVDLATAIARVPAAAVTASTLRSYSRIRYEPGVHVGM